jgi:hypothetical protein
MHVHLEAKLNRHHDFAFLLVGCHVALGLDNICQGERAINDRFQRTGF